MVARGGAIVLVDHYQATAEYFQRLREAGVGVAVIDDLADRDLAAVDWILNQNPFADQLDYPEGNGATVLRGLNYALLREQFVDARAQLVREFDAPGRKVLVTLGGSGVERKCAAIVQALGTVERRLDVRVVLGAAKPDPVVDAVQAMPHDVAVLQCIENMADQMVWADVALSAGGSTCWEMCCLGVPMVLTGLSPDQARNLPVLADAGVAVSTGMWDDATPQRMVRALVGLMDDPEQLAEMSCCGRSLVDGAGADRAAASLMALAGERHRRSRNAEVRQ